MNMYELEDLFDMRSVVGARLEEILEEKGYTKAELYKNTKVSRPTIDKILAGTITSKKNYENHMEKIMNFLKITPDILLGNKVCGNNSIREIRNLIRFSTKEMACKTGISIKRLRQIEAGEEATTAELRDIAVQLFTSTRILKGEYFFEPQVGEMDALLKHENKENVIGGFWGHVGILLKGTSKYHWFPITGNEKERICEQMNQQQLVISCMNNKVLYLYLPNVVEITFSDFDCDIPCNKDWDPSVDCGETPLAFYEALEDYEEYQFMEPEEKAKFISPNLERILNVYVEKEHLTDEHIWSLLNDSMIHYISGRNDLVRINFDTDTISDQIAMVYGYEMDEIDDNFLYFTNELDKSEVFVNIKSISMIEVPLLKIEKAICEAEK